MLEVNCETDFVARGDKFKELVADLAMQIAASPAAVTVVSKEDVPAADLDREREMEMQKEDLQKKPENIRYGSACLGMACSFTKQMDLKPLCYSCSLLWQMLHAT